MEMRPVQVGYIDSPSGFYDGGARVFDGQQTTPVSDFAEKAVTAPARPEWKEEGLRSLAALISNRFGYLEGLENLEPDWASGSAVNPSASAIMRTKGLLALIGRMVIHEEVSLIPRIVIGPTPSGGMIVELHADDENAINVTIANDDHVEVEVLYGGHYFDVDLQGSEVIGMVTAQYASISR